MYTWPLPTTSLTSEAEQAREPDEIFGSLSRRRICTQWPQGSELIGGRRRREESNLINLKR
jgi:hypothetical protein